MLTNFLLPNSEPWRDVNDSNPGVVYAFGASFEFTGTDYHSEGPRVFGWLSMYLAHRGFMLVAQGKPGDSYEHYIPLVDGEVVRRDQGGITQKLDACLIGLSGQGLILPESCITDAISVVLKLKTISDTVIALDFPPIEGRDVPYLTEGVGVDPYYWDNVWRPAYRAAMTAVGAEVVIAHYDWEPNNSLIDPSTSPYPDYHINSISAKRAAKRVFNYLMKNTTLGLK